MFGMLDYRAQKLFWLLSLPLRLLGRIAFFINVLVAIWIARWTELNVPFQIVIGYLAFEAVGMFLVMPIFGLLNWLLKRIFFFVIDVVPARGANAEEAKAGVTNGRSVWLGPKMDRDIGNWSEEDTDELASLVNWRGRLFFRARERLESRLVTLKNYYYVTGKQPGELTKAELNKMVGYKWFEIAVIDPRFFNSIFAFALIMSGVLYISTDS